MNMTPRGILIALSLLLAMVSAGLVAQRQSIIGELDVLAEASAAAVDATVDAGITLDVDRIRLALERARSASAKDAVAHLALELGDGRLSLERGEIVLRATAVRSAVPRGVHLVESIEPKLIRLSGGYSLIPVAADDTTDAVAGTVRVPRADFEAMRPNLAVGMNAFFF